MDALESALLSAEGAGVQGHVVWMAQQALQSNQQSFITMANQVFEKHRTAASGDLAQKKDTIAAMLKPLGETVARYQKEQREDEAKDVSAEDEASMPIWMKSAAASLYGLVTAMVAPALAVMDADASAAAGLRGAQSEEAAQEGAQEAAQEV